MGFRVPAELANNCRKTPERAAWLGRLAGTVAELERLWELKAHEPFDGVEGSCAWVAPVTRKDGATAVMKVGMPHFEGAHEIAGLRFWAGNPTVHLLESDERLGAMLMERCEPGTALRGLPEPAQDVVVARLLVRLWRVPPAPHPFRPLTDLTRYWSDETLASASQWPDAGLVREGLGLFEQLPRTATQEVLIATDLHAGNILRSQREPWLAIDPKPFVGDPAFDATQHLFNCRGRLLSDPDGTIKRVAEMTGLDHQRVGLWAFARASAEPRSNWSSESPALARAIARLLH